VAVVPVAAVPVSLLGERLVAHPEVGGEALDWLLAVAGVYALAALAATVPLSATARVAVLDTFRIASPWGRPLPRSSRRRETMKSE
jgi:hypothetical protein